MPNDKVLSMIGLARRAGKISGGAQMCEKAIKSGRSRLVIIARDISENGRKSITDACKFRSVKYIEYADKYSLAQAVGAESARTVISVNDDSFADAVLQKYADLQSGRNGD